MSRQIQFRRGTASEHNDFTGAIGEVTMDTDNKTLRVHDGETVGGTALAKQSEIPDLGPLDYVIEWQMPNANNSYTWYRKYKSGWVEQGGIQMINYTFAGNDQEFSCNLTKAFSNTNYTVCINCIGGFSTTRKIGIENTNKSNFSGFIQQGTNATLQICWNAYGF